MRLLVTEGMHPPGANCSPAWFLIKLEPISAISLRISVRPTDKLKLSSRQDLAQVLMAPRVQIELYRLELKTGAQQQSWQLTGDLPLHRCLVLAGKDEQSAQLKSGFLRLSAYLEKAKGLRSAYVCARAWWNL